MPSFINTNMASLNTQNNLTKSQGALNTSIQRLSSGMRVNSAKDDAAGMAIANRMDSSIRGNTVAMRNANDAISFSQTAEGALSKINDNLQRMRELAVQSANGSNGDDDRTLLNTEFTQLKSEISRIQNNTRFNGIDVLKAGQTTFQIGEGTGNDDRISITVAASTNLSASVTAGVNINKASGVTGTFDSNAKILALTDAITKANDAVANPTDTAKATLATTALNNLNTTLGGGSALTQSQLLHTKVVDNTGASVTGSYVGTTASSVVTLSGTLAAATSGTVAINDDGQTNSTDAITKIDAAIKEVNIAQINHGANQNRFTAVIATLQTAVENQTTARSRIMDTDYAAETAHLARSQILQQAGMAMLAQANQLPNGVMGLLR